MNLPVVASAERTRPPKELPRIKDTRELIFNTALVPLTPLGIQFVPSMSPNLITQDISVINESPKSKWPYSVLRDVGVTRSND
ncbi:hypothetical protein Trydic_g11838 [Trypoxylus dichotomus]